jgi:hypothetical protein
MCPFRPSWRQHSLANVAPAWTDWRGPKSRCCYCCVRPGRRSGGRQPAFRAMTCAPSFLQGFAKAIVFDRLKVVASSCCSSDRVNGCSAPCACWTGFTATGFCWILMRPIAAPAIKRVDPLNHLRTVVRQHQCSWAICMDHQRCGLRRTLRVTQLRLPRPDEPVRLDAGAIALSDNICPGRDDIHGGKATFLAGRGHRLADQIGQQFCTLSICLRRGYGLPPDFCPDLVTRHADRLSAACCVPVE